MKTIHTLLLSFLLLVPTAYAAEPVATDSRIRTFVYSASEVFPLTIHYGYQSYIEFAKGEEVDAISLGDAYPWKITPMKNRLFIKPIDGYSHTNMTVITNKRTYQFDLQSKVPPNEMDADLTYVVRFYYPDNSFDRVQLSGGVQEPKLELPMPQGGDYNFNYSLVGPNEIAPTKVFDDGQATYFEFPNNNAVVPSISVVEYGGSTPLTLRRQGNFLVADKIAGQFALRFGQQLVCVFNENTYVKGSMQ